MNPSCRSRTSFCSSGTTRLPITWNQTVSHRTDQPSLALLGNVNLSLHPMRPSHHISDGSMDSASKQQSNGSLNHIQNLDTTLHTRSVSHHLPTSAPRAALPTG